MEKGSTIMIGVNVVEQGPFFIKDQKAVGTVEDSELEQNVIFINDEDIIDYFVGGWDEEDLLEENVRKKVDQVKTLSKKMLYRNNYP